MIRMIHMKGRVKNKKGFKQGTKGKIEARGLTLLLFKVEQESLVKVSSNLSLDNTDS